MQIKMQPDFKFNSSVRLAPFQGFSSLYGSCIGQRGMEKFHHRRNFDWLALA